MTVITCWIFLELLDIHFLFSHTMIYEWENMQCNSFYFFLFYRTSSLQSFVTEFIQNIFLGQVHATVSSSIAAATKGKQLCSYIELSILTYHTWFINKQTIILISIINIRMVFVSESETNKLRSFIHSFQIIDNHI